MARRTGAAPHLMLFQVPNSRWAGAVISLVFYLVATGFLIAGIMAGAESFRRLFDRGDPLWRLGRRLSAAERSAGVVRAAATAEASGGDGVAACRVAHQYYVSGKNGGWRVDQNADHVSDYVLRTADGREYQVQRGTLFAFEPAHATVVEEPLRARLLAATAMPETGRIVAQCLHDRDPVWVEGCATEGVLTGCGAAPLVLDPGSASPRRRIAYHGNQLMGGFAGLAASLLALLTFGWKLTRARPLVDALRRRAGETIARRDVDLIGAVVVTAVLVAMPFVFFVGVLASESGAGIRGYVFSGVLVAVASAFAVGALRRRGALRRALAPVRDAATVPLAQAVGGVVELAVRVAKDAPTVPGPLSARDHAFVRVQATELAGQGKHPVRVERGIVNAPKRVPVEDASGRAWLDLTHAEVDLPATVAAHGLERVRPLFADGLREHVHHRGWSFEESWLDPGEALYVLGEVSRVEAPADGRGYREASFVAEVAGTEARPLVVHAGDERSLVRLLERERLYLEALAASCISLATTLVVLGVLLRVVP